MNQRRPVSLRWPRSGSTVTSHARSSLRPASVTAHVRLRRAPSLATSISPSPSIRDSSG